MKRLAGTEGAMIVVRGSLEEPWSILGKNRAADSTVAVISRPEGEANERDELPSTYGSNKRSLEGEIPSFSEDNRTKRARTADVLSVSSPNPEFVCTAPPELERAIEIYEIITKSGDYSLGSGDIFLTEGWRSRWCQCAKVAPYSFKGLSKLN